jgi:hypothetical protein
MPTYLEIALRTTESQPAADKRAPARYQPRTTSVPVALRIDPSRAEQLALCGSPHCVGCYEVEPSVRIHPPGSSEAWREWLLKWKPTGQVQ